MASAQAVTGREISTKPYIDCKCFYQVIASDHEAFVLRRFSSLTARVLLLLQDGIAQEEAKLALFDNNPFARIRP